MFPLCTIVKQGSSAVLFLYSTIFFSVIFFLISASLKFLNSVWHKVLRETGSFFFVISFGCCCNQQIEIQLQHRHAWWVCWICENGEHEHTHTPAVFIRLGTLLRFVLLVTFGRISCSQGVIWVNNAAFSFSGIDCDDFKIRNRCATKYHIMKQTAV